MKTVAVIPALNEATHIGPVVEGILKYVDAVVVVDDGSTDATVEQATKGGAHVVSHAINCGAGAATMTGIEAARRMGAEIIVTIDADGQFDAKDIPTLLAPIKDGTADVSFADRFAGKNNIPFIRRIFNLIGNVLTVFATGKWMRDSQSGFKAFGPKAIEDIDLRMSGFEFCTEIVRETVQHNWRIAQIPTKVVYSEYSMAKGQSFANGVRTAFKILLRSFLR